MNVDVLDLPSEYDSPTSPAEDTTWYWSGFLLEKLKACESYEIFRKLKICNGLQKLYVLLLERRRGETAILFDNGLFVLFILLFIVFLITSVYTIFAEDRKSLKEISNKVRKTTDAIVNVLRSFWTLREVKVSNLRLEAECKKKVLKMKLPTYLFDGTRIQTLRDGTYVPVAGITTTGDEQMTEILYTQEEEFPVETDWTPPDEKRNEIKQEIASAESDEPKIMNNELTECSGSSQPCPMKDYPIPCAFSNLPTVNICKMEISSTALEMIPEVNLSDRDNILAETTWIGKRRRIPGSGRITIPPYPKEFQVDFRKRDQRIGENGAQLKRGIFEQRRQNIERARRTKSFERNPFRSSWDSDPLNRTGESSLTKAIPRKPGIINRSFHKIPLPSAKSVK